MRISDWSSDVCSSDRLGLVDDALEGAIGHSGVRGTLEVQLRPPLDLRERRSQLMRGVRHEVAQLPFGRIPPPIEPNDRRRNRSGLGEQIGRASCRARGWQYV